MEPDGFLILPDRDLLAVTGFQDHGYSWGRIQSRTTSQRCKTLAALRVDQLAPHIQELAAITHPEEEEPNWRHRADLAFLAEPGQFVAIGQNGLVQLRGGTEVLGRNLERVASTMSRGTPICRNRIMAQVSCDGKSPPLRGRSR